MTRRPICILVVILVFLITVKSASAKPWTVVDAVQSAISTHPQSLIAETMVEEARGERRSAIALPAPVLSTRWGDIPSNSGLSDFEERRIGISQDFEFPLRYIWLTKAANLKVDQSISESRAILLDLECEVRQAYLEAWFFSVQVRILEEYEDSIKTYSSHIQALSERGGISRLDTRRSRVEVLKAESELRASQCLMIAAFDRLSRMTGYDLNEIELISPIESDPVDTTGIVESKLFASNPEVLIARTEVGISGYEERLASAAWLPELELTYFHRNEIYPNDPDDLDSWAFELELTVPVWFWWGGVGEIRASRAQLNRAKAELAAYRLELSSESSLLRQEVKYALEQYELYRHEILPLAKDEYQMAKQSFQLGDGTYMDLIDAQNELKDVHQDYIEIMSELYEKRISLDRLHGNSIVDDMSKLP
ncbi:TolC family protein [bacterium]|nr:TolC family protein [bacterium]